MSLVYSCQYHIIFCPKYRRKVLINGIDGRLKELMLEKQEEFGYTVGAVTLAVVKQYIEEQKGVW